LSIRKKDVTGEKKKKDLPYNFAGTHQFGDVWDTSIICEKVHKIVEGKWQS